MDRYPKKFKLLWIRGDAAFASTDIYEQRESS
jgi:hypothetical protein